MEAYKKETISEDNIKVDLESWRQVVKLIVSRQESVAGCCEGREFIDH
jgi:hypothetical protein